MKCFANARKLHVFANACGSEQIEYTEKPINITIGI